MSATHRWQTLESVKTCLQAITIAGGYNTDAGLVVTTEPAQVKQDASAVLAVQMEELLRATEPGFARTHRLMTFLVAIRVPTDLDDAQGTLDLAIDDVERAMQNKQTKFPAGVVFPRFEGCRPSPAPDNGRWIGAIVRYSTHVPIR